MRDHFGGLTGRTNEDPISLNSQFNMKQLLNIYTLLGFSFRNYIQEKK